MADSREAGLDVEVRVESRPELAVHVRVHAQYSIRELDSVYHPKALQKKIAASSVPRSQNRRPR